MEKLTEVVMHIMLWLLCPSLVTGAVASLICLRGAREGQKLWALGEGFSAGIAPLALLVFISAALSIFDYVCNTKMLQIIMGDSSNLKFILGAPLIIAAGTVVAMRAVSPDADGRRLALNSFAGVLESFVVLFVLSVTWFIALPTYIYAILFYTFR